MTRKQHNGGGGGGGGSRMSKIVGLAVLVLVTLFVRLRPPPHLSLPSPSSSSSASSASSSSSDSSASSVSSIQIQQEHGDADAEAITKEVPKNPPHCHLHFLTTFFNNNPIKAFTSTLASGGDPTCAGQFQIQMSYTPESSFPETADVYLAHFREQRLNTHLLNQNNNSSIAVIWGVENAAFSPALNDGAVLRLFDYAVNSNVHTAAIPLYSIRLPPTKGHQVPPYSDRPHFAMFAWSHCEPIRTDYAKRMMDYADKQHTLKVASMGRCVQNDATFVQLQRDGLCPDYFQDTWDLRPLKSECRSTTFPDVAARRYKFSLVFQNADCDYWIDLRLQTAWSSGSIVVFMGTQKAMLQTFVPPALMDAMIFAEDYDSPEALVDAMVAIDEAEFTRRLAWTTKGYDPSLWYQAFHGTDHAICQLCRLRYYGSLQDGSVPLRKDIRPDRCHRRKRDDWLK
jgi:hypothetical protein